MVSENTELHPYCVQRLYAALVGDISQQPLCKVALWTIGEYGDLLLTSQTQDGLEPQDVRLYFQLTSLL
jgi:hypothetical protein